MPEIAVLICFICREPIVNVAGTVFEEQATLRHYQEHHPGVVPQACVDCVYGIESRESGPCTKLTPGIICPMYNHHVIDVSKEVEI